MSQLKTVKLYGAAQKFGGNEPLEMVTNDNRDTFSMLQTWFPEFKRFMRENPQFVIVVSDKDKANPRPIPIEFAMSPYGDCEEVHIFPAAEGAGLEAALIAAGWSAFAAGVAVIVVNVVIGLAISAIMAALAPKPEVAKDVKEDPSFLFNGPENVMEQGYQLPIIYGTHMTGSVVLSAGVHVEQTGRWSPSGAETTQAPSKADWAADRDARLHTWLQEKGPFGLLTFNQESLA